MTLVLLVLVLAGVIGSPGLVVAPDRASALSAQPVASPPAASRVPAASAPATTVRLSPEGFSPTGAVAISGARQPGSIVTVTMEETGEVVCVVDAGDSRDWACPLEQLPNGAGVTLIATERPERGRPPAPGRADIDVLRPPLMDGSGSYLTTGLVSGTGEPGAVVTVSVEGEVDARCAAVPVPANSQWSCNLSSGSGEVLVRAQQSIAAIAGGSLSAYSNPQTVTVDRDLPASAVILTPTAGAVLTDHAVTVTGTGEDAGTVDVYLDDVPACSTVVSGSSWSCVIERIPAGDHAIKALQRDRAGNFSSPSAPVAVSRPGADAGPAAPAAPGATTPSASSPPVPTPTATRASPSARATPSPVPSAPAATPPPAPSDEASAGPPPAGGSGAPPASGAGGPVSPLRGWAVPTGFGTALSSPAGAGHAWYDAPVLGILFLALVALPLHLLVSTLRERMPRPRITLLGRNRGRGAVDPAAAPARLRLASAAVPLGVATVLILLTAGVAGEVRYVRLLLAVALGLVVLNVAGSMASTGIGARRLLLERRMRLVPLMLVAAVATALLSRAAGIDPPVVAGVLLGPVFAAGASARGRGLVSLVQLLSVTALGFVGWLLHEVVAPGPLDASAGFWSAFASETLATICLAGLGSALVLVLPLGSLPGRAVLEWSPPVWTATALAIASIVAFTVGGASTMPALLPWILAAAGFAAVSVAAWAYIRFVEPYAGL